MLWFQDDSLHFDANRCCQCGTCIAACKTHALSPGIKQDGIYEIKCDSKKCTGTRCSKCVASCPAHDLHHLTVSEKDWDKLIGVFLGQARDSRVSTAASSGGVGRTLLKTALDHSFCERAYCVVKADRYPWAEGRYLKGEADLASISNSMYLPILVNKNLEKIHDAITIIVIGTNCQLMGMDLFYRKSSVRLIKVALLCKQQKTFEFTRFIARRLGLKIDFEVPIKYRGNGWPGKMKIAKKELRWDDAATLPYIKKLWMIPGCRFCAHPLGWNADVTLADPWGISSGDKQGKTMVFIRTDLGKALIDLCRHNLLLEKIDSSSAKKSVDWEGIKRKQRIIPFYLGDDVPWKTRMIAKMADCQRLFYEHILERVRLPRFALRVVNRIPFLERFM